VLKADARDGLLVLRGDAGYDEAGAFERACEDLLGSESRPVVMDLSGLHVMASPCVARVYEVSRRLGYGQMTVRISKMQRTVFAPGEMDGLFKLEVAGED